MSIADARGMGGRWMGDSIVGHGPIKGLTGRDCDCCASRQWYLRVRVTLQQCVVVQQQLTTLQSRAVPGSGGGM